MLRLNYINLIYLITPINNLQFTNVRPTNVRPTNVRPTNVRSLRDRYMDIYLLLVLQTCDLSEIGNGYLLAPGATNVRSLRDRYIDIYVLLVLQMCDLSGIVMTIRSNASTQQAFLIIIPEPVHYPHTVIARSHSPKLSGVNSSLKFV